ncbi:porin family protein [Ectothiorhodospiraceae bacterium 2226]|nr:porin family protein [Ectothiorhodospiraceae bacterium 2226]
MANKRVNTKLSTLAAAALALAIAAPGAHAFGTGGYVIGSLGSTDIDEGGESDFGSETSYKGAVGVSIANSLAVEVGYTRLGRFDARGRPDANARVDGVQVALLAGAPVGPVTLFGKAGFYHWDSRVRGEDFDPGDVDGTDVMYGAGVQFTLPTPVGVLLRAEYERFDNVLGTRADMMSVGVGVHF